MLSTVNNRYIFWALLAVPAINVLRLDLLVHVPNGVLLFKTGIYSARLLVVALSITPLCMMFPRARWTRWLASRRRYIGVAGFSFAAWHTVYFVAGSDLAAIGASFTDRAVLPGWLSVVILAAMAATSNDYSVRRLGPTWKKLQRWGYAATALALAHWLLVEFHLRDFLIYVVPVSLLAIYRFTRPRRRAANRVNAAGTRIMRRISETPD
ncbi:MAG: iron reductase [Paracoccaceae bacterium]